MCDVEKYLVHLHKIYILMADNYLEKQYAAYQERKAALKRGRTKSAPDPRFYTRPGKKTQE